MGTRSILAYQPQANKPIHCQYQQFDGYPTVRGSEYFEFARKAICECRHHFTLDTTVMDDGNKPSKAFFDALKDYCNFARWRTAHSFQNKWKCENIEAFKTADAWQEWMYLFDSNGDFHVFHGRNTESVLIFPFAAMLALADHEFDDDERSKPKVWEPFWTALEENMPAKMVISYGQRHSFPEQKDGGWRDWTTVAVSGAKKESEKPEKVKAGRDSMFADRGESRNTNKIVVASRIVK